MIQTSPPINSESPQAALTRSPKTIPDKLGVFSKLLEGLRRNFKTGPQGSGQTMDPEGDPSIRGEAPPEDGERVPIKKTNPRGVKTTLFPGGNERLLKKETFGSAEGVSPAGEKRSKIPRGKTEESQGAAAEETASLLIPKDGAGVSLPPKTAPEGSPQSFSEVAAAEEALSGKAGRPGPQNRVNSVEVPPENHPRDRKTGEILRGLGELSRELGPERGPEAARLVRAPEKSPQDTEKAGRTNPRRTDPASGAKRRERGGPEVRDLRTGLAPEVPVNRVPAFAGEAAGGSREVELRVDLPGNSRSSAEGLSAGGGTPARAFEEVLAGELRGGLGDDIVRQASIILKDGGAGIIRLALKPESLGNVKIRLEMAENKIAGRIIVESNEALRAFEKEIQSLEQAFRDSGFNGASIEMSVSSDNGGSRGNRQGKGEDASPFFSERLHLAASGYESAGDLPVLTGNSGASSALGPVNMLV